MPRTNAASPAAEREPETESSVATVRRFNRFYTRQIGALQEGLLDSPFTLTQSRVLYELAHGTALTATVLANQLALDQGYLSRVLRALHKQRLVARTRSEDDNRHYHLALTATGRRAVASLEALSEHQAASALAALTPSDQRKLLSAMNTIESLLSPTQSFGAIRSMGFLLRDPLPGDLGYIVHRQAALYALEYGFGQRFEGLVAEVVAHFVANFDPAMEKCWIAERDGAIIGSVFLVRKSAQVSKLRLLYVEPSARGLGVGRRLVQECLRFARSVGYRRMTLWTQAELVAARGIYASEGFTLVSAESHRDFGPQVTGETWECAL